MTAELVVRPASEDDAGAIADVGSRAFTAAYADSTRPADLAAHIAGHFTPAGVRRAMSGADARYLLAVKNGRVLAFARLGDPGKVEGLPAARAIEIRQLYVEPEVQRQGAGRRLLEQALAVARRDRVDALWLSAWEKADWALAFYYALGFRAFGSADFSVGATVYRDVLLWLPVSLPSDPNANPG